MGSKDGEVLVIHCPIDEKEILLEAAPEICFETAHYKDFHNSCPTQHMKGDELTLRIETAWRMHASKRHRAEYEARSTTDPFASMRIRENALPVLIS
jgi:hypothetical protein